MLGHTIRDADERQGRAELRVQGPDGQLATIRTDHVIAATGYRFDVRALPFLGPQLAATIRAADGWPLLSTHFESSVPGLYFTGLASARHFGPVMRFLVGADCTARRVAAHVAGREQQTRTRPKARGLAASARFGLQSDAE
jgi:hypothetical protein